MIISPFMELDDERRKRDQAMMQSLGNFGSSLASVPLTYQSLLNEQQDRSRKIDKDKQELLFKKNQEKRETESHDLDMENGHQNLEKSKFDLERGHKQMDNEEQKIKEAKDTKSIHDMVAGKLAENPDMDSKALIDSALADPSWKDLPDPNELEAEVNKQLEEKRRRAFDEGIKTKGLDIKEKAAEAKARRMSAAKLPKPPPKLALKYADELADLDSKYQQVVGLQKYREQENIDTGPLAGAVQWLRQASHTQNPQEAVLNGEFKSLLNHELHDLSGATVTDNEYRRLAQMLPSQFDDQDVWEAIAEVSKEAFERQYNTKLSTYQKAGYDTGGITPLGEPKKTEANQNSDMGSIISQVRSEHPDWSKDQVKAEVRKRMGR